MKMFLNLWVKLFFLLTPFFALTMFLAFTEKDQASQRRTLALSVSGTVALLCLLLFIAGRQLLDVFGITLDSFRIGAGVLLLLSGINLVQGRVGAGYVADENVAVVPLAIPIIVGPSTTGTILVLSAELSSLPEQLRGCAAILSAVACVGAVLYAGSNIQRALGARGIAILSRLTGLVLTALAAQMVMTGIQGYLDPWANPPPGSPVEAVGRRA